MKESAVKERKYFTSSHLGIPHHSKKTIIFRMVKGEDWL